MRQLLAVVLLFAPAGAAAAPRKAATILSALRWRLWPAADSVKLDQNALNAVPGLPDTKIKTYHPAVGAAVATSETALDSLQAAAGQDGVKAVDLSTLFDGRKSLDARLSEFGTRGFASVPVSELVPAGIKARAIKELAKKMAHYEAARTDELKNLYSKDGWARGYTATARLVDGVMARLVHLFPSERLRLARVYHEVTFDMKEGGRKPHFDTGYINVAIVLEGHSSAIYVVEPDGTVYEIEPPDEYASFFTNLGREAALGLPTTLHSASRQAGPKRRVLLLQIDSASGAGGGLMAVGKGAAARLKRVRAVLGLGPEEGD